MRPRTRVRFPPPPPQLFELIGEFCLKRRRIWRRLCVSAGGGTIERGGELVELDLIRIELRSINPRVAHEAPECTDVATALTHETICEAVPQLMRRNYAHAGAVAHSGDHSPERLPTRATLRVLPPPHTFVLRNPLLDLDGEDVIIGAPSIRSFNDWAMQTLRHCALTSSSR